MDEEADFLRAIAARPADDAPRLVYADWLEERDDPRAKFVRREFALTIFCREPNHDKVLTNALRQQLRIQRKEFDWWWVEQLTRASALTQHTFFCTRCELQLTKPLWPLGDQLCPDGAQDSPLIPSGFCWQATGDIVNIQSHYCVNLDDLTNTKHHSDTRRLTGCCGPSGLDGLNIVCNNGHEVGTECSDCWMPHYLHWEPSAVTIEKIIG
jgi:uncharacterized protein (TIGR02996 family)